MNYEIVTLEEKIVVGAAAQTGNQEPDMQQVIGGLWGQLYGGIIGNIRERANEYAIGLYSDYNDSKDNYTVTVGCEVKENKNPELAVKVIPAGRYAKFSIHGDMVKAVADTWQEIWSTDLKRTYTGDFEEYVSHDGNEADINIYIAVE